MGAYGVELETLSIGLLLARVVFGLVMAAHGAQKLLGWFGGYGLNKTGEVFGQQGFRPRYSLDAWLGILQHWTTTATWIVLAAGVLGGFANVALRRRPTTTAGA